MLTEMTRKIGIAAGLALALTANTALAQSNPRYVQFRPSATKAALYTPANGPAPTVAFLAIHRTSNFMNMISTRELAGRSFLALGMNPRSDNNGSIVNFEDIALEWRDPAVLSFTNSNKGQDNENIGHCVTRAVEHARCGEFDRAARHQRSA